MSLKKTPALIERIFTEKEKNFLKTLSETRKMAYCAKRFAAKEALSKACGTGIGSHLAWQDMSILNDKSGAPCVVFSPKAGRFLQKKFGTKKIQVFISLTDEKEYAMAFAILAK